MIDWHQLPATRDLIWTTPSCEWVDHVWVSFVAQFDFPDRSEQVVIAYLCQTCGRDLNEAIGSLPVVVKPAIYPEPVVKR